MGVRALLHPLFAASASLRGSYADVDWATTPLGPVESWSPALTTAVDLVLNTQFPVTLLWGPELVLVYNEGYVEMIGDKHPSALGRPCAEVFPEAWEQIEPLLRGALAGEPMLERDALLPLARSGFLEETYFTFGYSPVRGADGVVEGVIDISVETTDQVVLARRLQLLADLGRALGALERLADLAPAATALLAAATSDFVEVEVVVPVHPARPGAVRRDAVDDVVLERRDGLTHASLGLHGGVAGSDPARLRLALHPMRPLDDDCVDFVRLVGAAVSQHLERLTTRDLERSLSETLQRSLLSDPPAVPGLAMAARYRPAAEQAQVGGDWYDAYLLPDGSTALSVGDVVGHDSAAAAAMGQLRNLARGVSFLHDGDAASTLRELDGVLAGLGLPVIATSITGRLTARDADAGGGHVFRWANAGHPPPVLIERPGVARLLEAEAEPLLGYDPACSRTEHTAVVPAGAGLVLYTDGLIEKRGEHLDDGIAALLAVLAAVPSLDDADAICEVLLEHAGAGVEDDAAFLVVLTDG